MFDNIGGKIKGLAKFLAWAGIIASVIGGFILFVSDPDDLGFLGFLVTIVGSLISWISSFLSYGFGQLIENSDILVEQGERAKNSTPKQPPVVPNKPLVRCSNCGAVVFSGKCSNCGMLSGDLADKIATLNQLKSSNLITNEEYEQKMAELTK